ncbi:MAG TPA: nuclear transport factor 2 family protein [Verrucomicrobiae bacterium]|nr:nuclear transport factor 2 family protein [Verrucomicrobiae bacterium]
MARTTTEVFEDHLQKRLHGDIEGDVTQNYAKDVVFLTGTGAFHGHEGVRQSAQQLAAIVGEQATFEYRHTLVDGPYAFLEWTATSGKKTVLDGADSFVIHDGKIVFQSIHYSTNKTKREKQ